MIKKFLMVAGALVVLGVVAGGSFYGGMLFQQQQVARIRSAFFADRGGGGYPIGDAPQGGGFGGGGNGFPGGGFAGRGANGQIKSIDGDTLTVSTPQQQITVQITVDTRFLKVVDAAQSDLAVGDTITVRGQADSNGNVTADSIQIGAFVPPAAP